MLAGVPQGLENLTPQQIQAYMDAGIDPAWHDIHFIRFVFIASLSLACVKVVFNSANPANRCELLRWKA